MRRVGMFTVYRKILVSLYSETGYPRGNKRQMLMHLSCAAPASGNLLRQRLWQVFSKRLSMYSRISLEDSWALSLSTFRWAGRPDATVRSATKTRVALIESDDTNLEIQNPVGERFRTMSKHIDGGDFHRNMFLGS